jgi:uncharacterized SAM-binding protein YcdF (DUF218 family)
MRRPAPRTRSVLRAAALALGVVWTASAASVYAFGKRDGARLSDAIVVLGAAQYAGRPSPVLRARLDHAVELYRRGLARWVIFTGGTGRGDTTSEAAVGRRYALRHGVPDSAILLESTGRSTNASLAGVAALMRERGLKQAIFVSDPFHMLRLWILAQRYGIDAITSPTRTSPISANRGEAVGYIVSESMKVPLTLLYAAFRT